MYEKALPSHGIENFAAPLRCCNAHIHAMFCDGVCQESLLHFILYIYFRSMFWHAAMKARDNSHGKNANRSIQCSRSNRVFFLFFSSRPSPFSFPLFTVTMYHLKELDAPHFFPRIDRNGYGQRLNFRGLCSK